MRTLNTKLFHDYFAYFAIKKKFKIPLKPAKSVCKSYGFRYNYKLSEKSSLSSCIISHSLARLILKPY
jgi:hypothetical protein